MQSAAKKQHTESDSQKHRRYQISASAVKVEHNLLPPSESAADGTSAVTTPDPWFAISQDILTDEKVSRSVKDGSKNEAGIVQLGAQRKVKSTPSMQVAAVERLKVQKGSEPKTVPEKLGGIPLRLILIGHNPSDHAWCVLPSLSISFPNNKSIDTHLCSPLL